MRYKRITLEERDEIFRLRYEERLSLRNIGLELRAHPFHFLRDSIYYKQFYSTHLYEAYYGQWSAIS
jgi:IS30 family transposase